jgi:carbamoylphosphate synthase small subunit
MDTKDEYGLSAHLESDEIQVAGLIVAEYTHEHSHWNAEKSLGEWLQQHNVPALVR